MTTRCYRSKIGRLPFAIRNELNERIRDGAGGSEILAWLNGLPATRKILRELKSGEINAQNLTDWRSSGYRDWLEDQAQADRILRMSDYLDADCGYDSVPDPYYGGDRDFELALDLIEQGCRRLLSQLQRQL